MTVWIFLAVHFAYGALMAIVTIRRMLAEGAVLGAPLTIALTPVALVSVPGAALLARFAGPWFLQGIPVDDLAVSFERFHLGFLLLLGAAVILSTVAGHFFAVAAASRDRSTLALTPIALALGATIVTGIVDGRGAVFVDDTLVFAHPVGLVSVAILICLIAAVFWGRSRGRAPSPEAA